MHCGPTLAPTKPSPPKPKSPAQSRSPEPIRFHHSSFSLPTSQQKQRKNNLHKSTDSKIRNTTKTAKPNNKKTNREHPAQPTWLHLQPSASPPDSTFTPPAPSSPQLPPATAKRTDVSITKQYRQNSSKPLAAPTWQPSPCSNHLHFQ